MHIGQNIDLNFSCSTDEQRNDGQNTDLDFSCSTDDHIKHTPLSQNSFSSTQATCNDSLAGTSDFPELKSVRFADLPHEGELDIHMCEGVNYTVEGEISTQKYPMVIDSAAQVSCLSLDVYRKLPIQGSVEARATLKGVGRKRTQAFKVTLPLKIGSIACDWPFYVVENDSPVLLGLDFIRDKNGLIDTVSEKICLQGEWIPMVLMKSGSRSYDISRVVVAQKVYIPPHSHNQVQVRFTRPVSRDKEYCIEARNQHACYLIGNTLVRGGKHGYVSIINDSAVGVTLIPNRHLGVATEIDRIIPEEEVQVYVTGEKRFQDVMQDMPSRSQGSSESAEFYVNACEKDNDTTSHSTGNETWLSELEAISQETDPDWGTRLSVVAKHMPVHLEKLFVDTCDRLNSEEAVKFGSLLIRYADRFSAHEFDIGLLQGVTHRINTGDAAPVKQPVRRSILALQEKEKQCIDKLVDMGMVVPSDSEWASPPLMVKKPDGSIRFCIDYRELNKRTVRDSYPLPLIEDCLDTLAGNKYFSKCDMSSAYYQILMDPRDQHKTAFNSRYGLFTWQRMPFGLCNAPATFMRAINLVLQGLTWKCVLAYLDDILVLGKDFEDHLNSLELVFIRMRQYNLKLKPSKCSFFHTEVDFLGRTISQEGMTISPSKISAVKEWALPENKKQLQSFVGFCNYFREHISNFAVVAAPLYDLCGANSEFVWTDEHTTAVERLKDLVTSAPCLAYPRNEGTFILDCDASGTAIGAVLSQVQPDGSVRPVSFASNVLLKEQRNYCITRKELLSVVKFTRMFRHYLLCREFVVRTDHSSLVWLLNFKYIEGQLARWLEELSRFNMKIQHRAGAKHINADALSRLPDSVTECANYKTVKDYRDLPCYPHCNYCKRAQDQWGEFKQNVDSVTAVGGPMAPTEVMTINVQPSDHDSHNGEPESIEDGSFVHFIQNGGFSVMTNQVNSRNSQTVPVASVPDQGSSSTPQAGSAQNHTDIASDSIESSDIISQQGSANLSSPVSVSRPNWITQYSTTDLKRFQHTDPHLIPIIQWLEDDRSPGQAELFLQSDCTKHLWAMRNILELRQGVLYYYWITVEGRRRLFVVPVDLKEKVMSSCHDLKAAGHLGIDKTYHKIIMSFYWPNMKKEIRAFVKSCNLCNRYKKFTNTPRAKQRPYHAGMPMERVHLDILGPFRLTTRGNKYVLVIVDQFSKWTECVALPDQTAESIAYGFFSRFVSFFGCPRKIHTDQGKNFDGNLFHAFCSLLEIVKTRTTPFHPQSNAQCETKNRIVLQMIRIFCDGKPGDWDYQLPFLCMALHATKSRSTGFTPNMLMLGREVTSPADLMFGTESHVPAMSPPEWVRYVCTSLEEAHAFARIHLRNSLMRQKSAYDLKSRETAFKVGDFVQKKQTSTKIGAKALGPIWDGPFLVIETRHPVYLIESKGGFKQCLHLDRLRRCNDRTIPYRLQVRRNELLKLDETIAADESEMSDAAGPFVPLTGPAPAPTAVAVPTPRPPSKPRNQTATATLPTNLPPVTTANPPVTRAGRTVRLPPYLLGYTQ